MVVAMAAVLAITPAAALAGTTRDWSGSYDTGHALTFKVHVPNAGRAEIRHFTYKIPLVCDGGPNTIHGWVTGAPINRHHEFHFNLKSTDPGTSARLLLDGTIHHHTHADGGIRVYGSAVPVDHGAPDNCDSGDIGWSASRD